MVQKFCFVLQSVYHSALRRWDLQFSEMKYGFHEEKEKMKAEGGVIGAVVRDEQSKFREKEPI
jgi:hypothetical protein